MTAWRAMLRPVNLPPFLRRCAGLPPNDYLNRGTMNCENCGLPEGCYTSPGERLTVNCEQKYKGCRRTKLIWCCSTSCATQQRAISEMGLPTSNWPITLAEFARQERAAKLRPREGLTVTKTIAVIPINTGAVEAEFTNVGLPPSDGAFVTPRARKGGRPRKLTPATAAERARRYRARKAA